MTLIILRSERNTHTSEELSYSLHWLVFAGLSGLLIPSFLLTQSVASCNHLFSTRGDRETIQSYLAAWPLLTEIKLKMCNGAGLLFQHQHQQHVSPQYRIWFKCPSVGLIHLSLIITNIIQSSLFENILLQHIFVFVIFCYFHNVLLYPNLKEPLCPRHVLRLPQS